jgi:hypothetical protein
MPNAPAPPSFTHYTFSRALAPQPLACLPPLSAALASSQAHHSGTWALTSLSPLWCFLQVADAFHAHCSFLSSTLLPHVRILPSSHHPSLLHLWLTDVLALPSRSFSPLLALLISLHERSRLHLNAPAPHDTR